MSIETDRLLTIAEIAATFAGFAALVSAIRRRSEDPETTHDILRLRITISSSVVIVVLALIPIGLSNYGLSETVVWQISGIVFMMLSFGVIWSFLTIYRPVEGQFPRDEWSVRVFVVLQVAIVVALLVAVFGVAPQFSYAVYITTLVCYLSQAAFVFVRFVESTLSPQSI